ncbi:hypothetical protein CTZ27_27510 [Streptomyces griseocarneus]|nr:hypothetical protein CTZ27_27510 [Streptomyces griseocarneus]
MSIRSAWLLNGTDSGGQTRVDTRLAPIGTMVPTGALTSRDGVVPGSQNGNSVMEGLYVFGDSTGMTAKVTPGRAIVQGAAGSYPVYMSDRATVVIKDGDAGNPRIDLVVLRVRDNDQDGSGQTMAELGVVEGVVAASPVAPEVPAGTLPLAEITVRPGASAGNGGIAWSTDVKDRRRPVVAVGGILPADVTGAYRGAYPGQYRDTGNGLERWNGDIWQPYPTPRAWSTYTPKWGAENGPQPKLGNGTAVGRYLKEGTVVHFYASIVIGTTTDWGGANKNGDWWLTLPVRPANSMPGHFRGRIGGAYYAGGCNIANQTVSGTETTTGVARAWTCSDFQGVPTKEFVDGDYPAATAPTQRYEVFGTYEAAA